jgi:hypothetical protein
MTRSFKAHALTKYPQIRIERRSPSYWRVIFDHPPLNIFEPETIPQLEAIVRSLELDERVKVVVFDSAVEGFLSFAKAWEGAPSPVQAIALPSRAAPAAIIPVMQIHLCKIREPNCIGYVRS